MADLPNHLRPWSIVTDEELRLLRELELACRRVLATTPQLMRSREIIDALERLNAKG